MLEDNNEFRCENFHHVPSTKRQKFTPLEDERILSLVCQFGCLNWLTIATFLPGRTAKQCRDRYYNYLQEPQTNEPWKTYEDEILLTLLSLIGPRWVEISRHLPGRSGNNVKNRWYKHLNKKYPYLKEKSLISQLNEEEKNHKRILHKGNESINAENKYHQIYKGDYSIQSLLV